MTPRQETEWSRRALGPHTCAAAAACLLALLLASWQPAHARQRPAAAAAGPKDGPVRVVFGELYKEGKTEFVGLDPASVAPLPEGYEPLGGAGYKVVTEAVAVGPHEVEFGFPSVNDRAVFESLRVLRAEWDKVDERAFWVDCAHGVEGGFKSDFNARTLTVSVERLGSFAVARLVEAPRPNTKAADLSVEIAPPRGRVNGNTDALYEVRVTNRGPDDATGVRLSGAGFSSDQFVSATGPERGRGRCKQDGSNYACKLDLLEKGRTAVFRVVLNPRESPRVRLPEEGQPFHLDAAAHAPEEDKNLDDNHAESSIQVYPDPNRAPSVKLLAPADGDLFAAPADIRLAARASDPEGGVAKVIFYDGETPLGEGVAAGKDEYRLDWRGARPGRHVLTVVVTDSGGRADYETRLVFVNGPLTVRVEGPADGAVLKTKYRLKGEQGAEAEPARLEASAAVGGAAAREVVFSLVYGMPGMGGEKRVAGRAAGVDRATGETRYAAVFDGLDPVAYRLTVVAVDEEGVETVSRPVWVRVSAASPVRLGAEQRDRGPGLAPEVVITAESVVLRSPLEHSGRSEVRVEFYADGKPIGEARADGFTGRARFVWADAPPGAHELTAVATNADGASSAPSPPLRITVRK